MRQRWWLWPAAAFLSADALVLALVAPLGSPWRPILALVFAFVGPGAALVPLVGLHDPAMELVLVVPVSFAVVALVAAALFYPGLWSVDRELAVLLGLCATGLVLQYRRLPRYAGWADDRDH
jgi:uncharacterized membrane protein